MKKLCIICGEEFDGRSNQKLCSDPCRLEHRKTYKREYNRRRYNSDEEFRERFKGYVKKYQEENREKISSRRKKWSIKNKDKIKEKNSINSKKRTDRRFFSRYDTTQINTFKELTERQQSLDDYSRIGPCYICEEKDRKRILHHVRYDPVETILLCCSCHSYLHHRFLNKKKVKPN